MRAMLHFDMGAGYTSVDEQDRPEPRGKPSIAGGSRAVVRLLGVGVGDWPLLPQRDVCGGGILERPCT